MTRSPRRQRARQSISLCLIGDTHELHRELEMPPADILIHVGDASMFSRSMGAILDFNAWLGELPYQTRIFVPGNHESFLEKDPRKRSLLSNALVLINEAVNIRGLNIWGSPVTPLYGGAFGLSSVDDRRRLYESIPEDTDVLITHGPPFGILDDTPQSGHHAGCPVLLEAVQRLQPALHVFGHIHGAYGMEELDDTLYVNAALLGSYGDLEQKPVVVRIARE